MNPLPYGTDQMIDAAMACSLHADARREHTLVAWVVMQDPPAYPDRFVARLATNAPTPYMLVADTLADLQAQLPPAARSGAVRAAGHAPFYSKELRSSANSPRYCSRSDWLHFPLRLLVEFMSCGN